MKSSGRSTLFPGMFVIIGLTAIGASISVPVCRAFAIPQNSGAASLIVWSLVLVLFATCAWPLFRGFQLRPLGIPRCPNCLPRQNHFAITNHWPKFVMQCLYCDHTLEAWVTDPPTTFGDVPRFVLRGPRFLGIWRRLSSSSRTRQ